MARKKQKKHQGARRRVERPLAHGHAWMRVILEASALATSRLEYAGTFGPVAAALRRLAPVDHFMIVLQQGGEAAFVVVETRAGKTPSILPGTRVPFPGSFLEHLKQLGRAYLIADLARESRFPEDKLILADGLRSCVRLPLLSAGAFVGMLALASRRPRAFKRAQLPYLKSLAAQVAHAVANIERYRQAKGEAERLAVIVREVHHRIKNNLQGVIGLLGRHRDAYPALAPVLNHAVSQLHAVAEVHNLLSHYTHETVNLHKLIVGVCQAVGSLSPHRLEPALAPATAGLEVASGEAVPFALVLNELIQNAVNHGYPEGRTGTIRVSLERSLGEMRLRVADDGVPPPSGSEGAQDFGVGLSLVRALLPKGASLALAREAGWTVAEVHLPLVL